MDITCGEEKNYLSSKRPESWCASNWRLASRTIEMECKGDLCSARRRKVPYVPPSLTLPNSSNFAKFKIPLDLMEDSHSGKCLPSVL